MSEVAPHLSRRSVLLTLAAVSGAAFRAPGARAADERPAPIPIQFALERAIDGLAAPFVLATTRGLYRAENINVSTSIAAGSKDTIMRVASGACDMALADLNALARYRGSAEDRGDAQPVKAVFILLNRAPYAIIARKSRGVTSLASLEDKVLGVADGDLAIRLWPALARKNAIKLAAVKQERISAAVREPMLSAGQVDAVTGFSYMSAVNLRDRGVPAEDLAVFRFADFGSAAYGLAVIANPAFASTRPDAVKAFLRATTAATRLVIAHPGNAIDDVLTQMENGSRELELARLRAAIADNILTDDVRRDGLGSIDVARLDASLGEIGEDFTFRKPIAALDLFDPAFLPDPPGRKIG